MFLTAILLVVPRRTVWLMLALTLSSGCDTLSPRHMMGGGARLWDHPWHSVPFKLFGFVAIVATGAVMLPAMFVEYGITGEFPAGTHEPGVTVLPVKYSAEVVGYAAALPFFVAGLPFEFLVRPDDRSSAQETPKGESESKGKAP